MDRDAMTKIAETVARQDDGDVNGIVELFAEDCTFGLSWPTRSGVATNCETS
jgi:hypothetical protein